jgi:hypothetical protein
MENEKEDIKKENTQETGEGHHKSWIGNIVEKIEDELENMESDFPLSGGEDHPIHPHHHHEDEASAEKGEEHHEPFTKHLLDNVDTDFPLSGAEEDL